MINTLEQIGKAIGRTVSGPIEVTIGSGTTTADTWIDMRHYAGGIVETPDGHTGTIYFPEADNYGGSNYGRLTNDSGTELEITDAVGGKPFTMPAGIYPAYWITLESSVAAPNDATYKVRLKG